MSAQTLRYVALALVCGAAVVYQVRYTIFRYPTWFGRQVVQYPFMVYPDSGKPTFSVYTFSGRPVGAIENGDEVLSINGKRVTGTAIFGQTIARSHPGDSLSITVRRPGGAPQTATVPLRAATSPAWTSAGMWIGLFLFVVFPWFCLLLGFWAAAARVQDVRAWILLGLMLSFAGYFSAGTESWEPWIRDFATAYHAAVAGFLTIWLFCLGIYFPEPFPVDSRLARWMRLKWLIIGPLAFEALCDVIVSIGALENYSRLYWVNAGLRRYREVFNVIGLAAVIGMWFCLAAKFRLAISADASRRLRVLVAGAVISLLPVLTLFVLSHAMDVAMEQYFPAWLTIPAWILFFLFPVTLAYVIHVHRAMDVRVVIRQGLQYALARRGVRVLRILLGIAIGLTMFSLLDRVGRSPLYFVVIAVAAGIWIWLRRLVGVFGNWVDRHFFRDAYNADQILAELSENVRSIVETRPLLATVAKRIAESLHVSRIAVLMDGSGPYQPAYALGYGVVPEVQFLDNAGTVRQLREAKEATRVYLDDPNSWVYKSPGVTEEERSRLAALEAELLLPLSVKDKLLGFISLGQKRSEEPYSPTDLRLLESVAVQTGLALEVARLSSAITEEIARRERLSRELEIAREVQERLFPQQPPSICGLDYCGACRPALGVGGDYYDFLPLAGGQLGIALGDVSGKGIAAALMMASLQASLRAEASRGSSDLGRMIGEVNRLLYEATTQNRYATFFYAQYDPSTRMLSYVNAGHNAPMLFKHCRAGEGIVRLETGGMVVGLLREASYEHTAVTLEPGDLLVAFTDGITETMNGVEEEWGESNLIRTIRECQDLRASEILERIMQGADAFAAGAPQHDDMTVMVMRVEAERALS